jgi:NAD-dependent DNA ligase
MKLIDMPSEKVTRILKARSAFTLEQIEAMTDSQGWEWIYANAKPRKERRSQVCFTGFSVTEKTALIDAALNAKLDVVDSVTKNLAFLCAGENAGPVKLAKAKGQGVLVLDKSQFLNLLETGEVPLE